MGKFASVFCVLLIVLLVLPIFLFGFVPSVNANPTVVTVGTSTASGPISMSFQKKTFYCSGNSRWYAWYDTGSQFGYETSLDGIDWTGAFTNYYASYAYYFDLWYDEANGKICLVRSQGTTANIYYRQGTAKSNGTITWDSAEVLITTDATYRPCLCKDSDGYPWVSYVAISSYDEKVCKATATNGSAWGTPTTLWTNRDGGNEQIKIVPLTAGKMLAISGKSASIQSMLYNGASWVSAVNASSSGPASYQYFDAVADGDNVHLIFCKVTSYNVTYVKYTYSSWGNEETVENSAATNPTITLKSTDKVRCFYYTSATTIKYRDRDEGVWQTAVTISSSQSSIWMVSSSYKAFSNYYCVMWKSKTSSPYNVTFEGYTLNTANGTGPVHNLNTGYNYTTIQEAIDANETLDGHTIFVEEGIYLEHVFVGKELTLIGENRSKTIIDGNGTGVVVELGTDVNVTNFTICNGEYGVRIGGSYGFTPVYRGNTINNCKITDNLYGAILIRGCANNTIVNNIIVNNTLFGIHLWHAGNNTIINNTVVNNRHGIDFYGNSNNNILRNNNMTDNAYNFGLILREETRNFLGGTSSKSGIVNDVDSSNTVNGKPIYYLVNRSDEQVPSDAGYVWLNNCTNIEVNGCNLSDNIQGVLLLFCNNASIINNNITNNVYGVYVGHYCNNNTLVGNTLKDNLNGIYLDDVSKFTTMRNNNISGGDMNFGVSPDIGRHISGWSGLINDIDTSNTVDGKPIIYWINQHDQKVPTNAGYVMLINSTNILIEGLNLSNNVQKIFLLGSNNTIIANNSVINSVYGIDVNEYGWIDYDAGMFLRFGSFNTTIKGNVVIDNCVGIRIISGNSTISNNTLCRNPLGILADDRSIISRNVVVASNLNVAPPPPERSIFYYSEWKWERSIELTMLEIGGIIVGGGDSLIYGNTVKDSNFGLVMSDRVRSKWGSGNIVFHNNFINNTPYQAIGAPKASNNYDNGYPSGGNYWSNYNGTDLYNGPSQNETGSDGISDEAFLVFPIHDFEVLDDYPLMAPITIFDVGSWNGVNHGVSIISNSTISNFQLNKTQKTISFNVTDETGFGFCRVTIPNVIAQEFWGGNCIVLVNGQPVESRNWMDESNAYIYFTYENPNEVVIIPEFSSFPIVLLFMMATLLAVTVRKRKSH